MTLCSTRTSAPKGLRAWPFGKTQSNADQNEMVHPPSGRKVFVGGVCLQGGNKKLWPLLEGILELLLLSRKQPRLLLRALLDALKKDCRVVFLRAGQRSRIALHRFLTQGRLRAEP